MRRVSRSSVDSLKYPKKSEYARSSQWLLSIEPWSETDNDFVVIFTRARPHLNWTDEEKPGPLPTQPYTCYKYSFRRKNLKMSTSNIALQHVQTVDHGQYDNHLQGTLKSAWSEGERSSWSVVVDIPSSDMSDMSLNDKRYMLDRGDRTTTSSLWREFILQSRSRICRKEIGKPCFVQKIVYLHATFSAVGSPLLVVLWISKN